MAAAQQQPPYEVLGYGSYGAVLQPALSNINANGKPVEFPGMVTKIFYKEKDMEKALSDAKVLRDKFPSVAIEYSPYKKKYVLSDFYTQPAVMRALLSGISGTDPNTAALHAIRMPYLGESIAFIARDRNLLKHYYALSPEKMIVQVLKMLYIIEALIQSGYVHGDVRDANILVNLETGELTLIDFDYLSTFDDIFRKFDSAKEWLPPEIIFFMQDDGRTLETLLKLPIFTPVTRNDYKMKMGRFVDTHIPPIIGMNTLNGELKNSMIVLYNEMTEKKWTPKETVDMLRKQCLESLDGYGLGTALVYLFKRMPTTGEYQRLHQYLFTILIPYLTLIYAHKRESITKLIRVTRQFIGKYYPKVDLDKVPKAEDETARLAVLSTAAAY
jgi:serine/threonine protein kinase